MRCLHCGKHLPLFRKLTGGGEFCSDAHRDIYHDEYNRLAVTRLLQAQTRPEDLKPAKKKPAPPPAAVAVAVEHDEPEPTESYIDEFRNYDFSPALVSASLRAIEIAPTLYDIPQVERPSIQVVGIQPSPLAGFVPMPPKLHQSPFMATAGDAIEVHLSCGMPAPADVASQAFELPKGNALTHPFMPAPLAIKATPFEIWVKPAEPRVGPVHIDSLPFHPEPFNVPKAPPVEFQLPQLVALEQGKPIAIEPVVGFENLAVLPPGFDFGLQLLGEDEEAPEPPPPPSSDRPMVAAELENIPMPERPEPESLIEAVEITPRRALDALSRLQYPPPRTSLVSISIPALAPGQAAAMTGFGALSLEMKPRLMRHSNVPLRPKMAVGNVSGPISARTGGARVANNNLRRASADSPKNMPRSMLHLEDESHAVAVETDADASSLFGKLGGLFGRKKGQ